MQEDRKRKIKLTLRNHNQFGVLTPLLQGIVVAVSGTAQQRYEVQC